MYWCNGKGVATEMCPCREVVPGLLLEVPL